MNTVLKISELVSLKAIKINDAEKLLSLMRTIYVPPYKHLWEDNGNWYVQNTFNSVVLNNELTEVNAGYYFVEFKCETIGILRIVHNISLKDFENKKASKLHRIYLDPKVHGKGIGKLLMDWSAQEAIKNNSKLIWLEAMDSQEQALKFYKQLAYEISGDFKLEFELMHKHLRGMYRMYLNL